jgi:hypothetical protein
MGVTMTNRNLLAFSALVVGGLMMAFGLDWPPKAKAVGPGFVENINVECGTSPTPIATASGKGPVALACECDATVAWGDSGVDISTDYNAQVFSGNVRQLWCDAAATTDCRCIAMVTQ